MKGVGCFQVVLIFGNVIIGLAGLALTAECIYFVTDQERLYPLLYATGNDDLFAAAWIGIFTGFCFFLLAILGIVGIMQSNRRMLMAYLIMMFIVFCFEMASSITAATQRDFLTLQLFQRQMLDEYNPKLENSVTRTWNYLMLTKQCCGVKDYSDWQVYNSTFRTINSNSAFAWPQQCCVMNNLGQPVSVDGCKLGSSGYLNQNGCYDKVIAGSLNRHAWGICWFGFAILCWTFWVLLGTMLYWTRIEY
ncbi:uroplakin-1b-like [Rana temporaria]|uniref:uroplakin-1b-like n=1 Tax=Rana temporaria TaxID=8407 RepID=UPI001AAD812C|nr:uroplakin-1b-like [Rana temporaria]